MTMAEEKKTVAKKAAPKKAAPKAEAVKEAPKAEEAVKEAPKVKKAKKEVEAPKKPMPTEARATATNVRVTPRKVRLVIDQVRGKDVKVALGLLKNINNFIISYIVIKIIYCFGFISLTFNT